MADNRKYAKALLDYVQMPMAQLGAVFGTTPQKMSKALRQEGSNIYDSMKSAVTAPSRALQGQMNPQMMMDENGNIIQDNSKMNQEAMNLAMNVAGGGFGSTIAKPAEAGSLGMFIGKRSPSFNATKADLFAQLQAKGINPQEAYAQTGTLIGPEGMLRQEISDKGSFLKGTGNFKDIVMNRLHALQSENPNITRMSIGDVMYHPKAFEAYPHLNDVEIRFMPKGINTKARADLNNNVIEVHPELSGDDAKSSILHELQHFVQEHEGFARGGNREEFYPELNKTKDDLLNQIHYFNSEMSNLAKNEKMTPDQKSAYDFLMNARNELVPEAQKYSDPVNIMQMASDKYKTLGGEAEARLAQTRRNLTSQEQLQHYPYVNDKNLFGLDMPFESLLVKK